MLALCSFFSLAACERDSAASVASDRLTVSPDVAKILQFVDGASLKIQLILDGNFEQPVAQPEVSVDASNNTITAFNVDLPTGTHTLTLRYIVRDPVFGDVLVAESNDRQIAIDANAANTLDLSQLGFKPTPDNDGDTFSNSIELQQQNRTDPNDRTKFPRATLGGGGSVVPDPSPSTNGGISSAYTLQASVAGLAGGETVTLENDQAQILTFTANGTQSFPATASSTAYAVVVKQQPASRHCIVSNGNGVGGAGDAINVTVNCAALASLGGTVVGMKGAGLVLQASVGNDVTVNQNGGFSFPQGVRPGAYSVSVKTQPSNPNQTCTFERNAGTATDAAINDLNVTCVDTQTIPVTGTVQGLRGRVVLRLDAAGRKLDSATITQNGPFTLYMPSDITNNYFVSVETQPTAVQCAVGGAKVTATASAISGYVVRCANLEFRASAMDNSILYTWDVPDADAVVSFANGSYYKSAPGLRTAIARPIANGVIYGASIQLATSDGATLVSEPQCVRPGPLTVNGEIHSIAVDERDGTAYIGGRFSNVYAHSGGGVVVPALRGGCSNFPILAGRVAAVVFNGGYWYVGGVFSVVKDPTFKNLIRIDSAGALDTNWKPQPDGKVTALAYSDGALYVGGEFTSIANTAAPHLVALDYTGAVAAGWRPNFTLNDAVDVLVQQNNRVYAGGRFTSAGSVARNHVLAADATTGSLLDWDPNADQVVRALAFANDLIYVGGDFVTIGGAAHRNLAAVRLDGTVETWSADVGTGNSTTATKVMALNVTDNNLYVGGEFAVIANRPRRRIAAFDLSTGLLRADWSPRVGPSKCCAPVDGSVRAIQVVNGVVYVGGLFASANDQSRLNAAAFDLASAELLPWLPEPSDPVAALSANAASVYIGGEFAGLGAQPRSYLAAIRPDGTLLEWNPKLASNSTGAVTKVMAVGSTVYATGKFDSAQNVARVNAAAFDTSSVAAIRAWDPRPNAHLSGTGLSKTEMSEYNGSVYLGGTFTKMGADTRNGLAVTTASTGQVLQSTFDLQSSVALAMAASNDGRLYVGGPFTKVGGADRLHLVAIDERENTVFNWTSPIGGFVQSLAFAGGAVYVGGNTGREATGITSELQDLATKASLGFFTAFDNVTSKVKQFDRVNGEVRAIKVTGGKIYLGGRFNKIGGLDRNGLGALNVSDGKVVSNWTPQLGGNPTINTLAVVNKKIYVGGSFTLADGTPASLTTFDP